MKKGSGSKGGIVLLSLLLVLAMIPAATAMTVSSSGCLIPTHCGDLDTGTKALLKART